MMEDCIFCKIASGAIPCHKIYEDRNVLAFLDIHPISRGHTLVIPKRHFSRLDDCPDDVIQALTQPLGKIAKALVSITSAQGYNVLTNNGRCAGQEIDHVHFHIIPRRSNDGVFNRWPAGEYETGEIESLAREIREQIQ